MSIGNHKIIGGGIDLSYLAARAAQQNKVHTESGATATNAQGSDPAAKGVAAEGGSAAPSLSAGGQAPGVDIPAVVFEVNEQTLAQATELSNLVPVLLLVTSAEAEQQSPQLEILSRLTRQLGGKIVLAVSAAENCPQLVAALQLTALPALVLIMANRPEMLYQGAQSTETLEQLLPQIVALAAQQGLSGRVNAPDLAATELPQAAPEPQLDPAHQEAFDAAERGDYAAAIKAYEDVLAKTPADAQARAALAQVRLLQRLQGKDMRQLRDAAAANPGDISAALAVADLDISGGHFEDGFLRILELFEVSDQQQRKILQERLLELFEVVGPTDPTVMLARRKLASLLY